MTSAKKNAKKNAPARLNAPPRLNVKYVHCRLLCGSCRGRYSIRRARSMDGGLLVRIGTAGVLHLNVHKIKAATF
jgi:hypothetical protein